MAIDFARTGSASIAADPLKQVAEQFRHDARVAAAVPVSVGTLGIALGVGVFAWLDDKNWAPAFVLTTAPTFVYFCIRAVYQARNLQRSADQRAVEALKSKVELYKTLETAVNHVLALYNNYMLTKSQAERELKSVYSAANRRKGVRLKDRTTRRGEVTRKH